MTIKGKYEGTLCGYGIVLYLNYGGRQTNLHMMEFQRNIHTPHKHRNTYKIGEKSLCTILISISWFYYLHGFVKCYLWGKLENSTQELCTILANSYEYLTILK